MLKKEDAEKSALQAVFSKMAGVLVRSPPDLGAQEKAAAGVEARVLEGPPQDAAAAPLHDLDKNVTLSTSDLAHLLEMALRAAKRSHLACGQVLLPCGLLQRISYDILLMSESEPYGIRGCVICISFESSSSTECRTVSNVKCDPSTAATFELHLKLKQDSTGWNFLSQFLNNFARGGTVVVSPNYVLIKRKLYRSVLE